MQYVTSFIINSSVEIFELLFRFLELPREYWFSYYDATTFYYFQLLKKYTYVL